MNGVALKMIDLLSAQQMHQLAFNARQHANNLEMMSLCHSVGVLDQVILVEQAPYL
jgi:hypothetical protein